MANRRSDIKESALSLFIEKGIRGTTTKEIAGRAGISEGAIYRHFEGKEELALELFLDGLNLFIDYLNQACQGNDPPPDRLRRTIRAFAKFATEQPKAYSYVVLGHYTEFRRVSNERLKPKDIVVALLQDGMEKGYFRQMDPTLAAAMIIGMVIRVLFFLEHGLTKTDPETAVEEICKASMHILGRE